MSRSTISLYQISKLYPNSPLTKSALDTSGLV